MNTKFAATFIAVSMLTVTAFAAKKPKAEPPTPPNIAASLTAKVEREQECVDRSGCTITAKASTSFSHTFEISSSVESSIQGDTSVTLVVAGLAVQVAPGQDPKYKSGNTAATITTEMKSLGFSIPMTVKLKWSKGQFSISAKGKGEMSDFEAEPRATLKTREPYGYTVETTIESPAGELAQVEGAIAVDQRDAEVRYRGSDGTDTTIYTIDAKSRFMMPSRVP